MMRRPELHAALALVLAACVPSRQAQRYERSKVQESLKKLETPGLVLGEFSLAGRPVLDGDTIRVEGLESTLRLLALDAEETLKDEQSRRDVEDDWPKYLQKKRGGRKHPVKAGTPMGEAAKKFAIKFFEGAGRVRLERDHPKEIRDVYDRYLAYAFVERNGKWINYNVECVRAGMSPYFTKYSYSRRFHDEFVAAEKEAREAKRGIWSDATQNYGDYDERKAWWDARANFIRDFERDSLDREDYIELTHWDSTAALEKNLGREVTVLGSVSRIILGDRGPTRVMLAKRQFSDFALVFFDKDVFSTSGIARYEREFVRVTGVVQEYKNKYNGKRQLQLIVNLPSQVVGSDVPGLEEDTVQAASAHP